MNLLLNSKKYSMIHCIGAHSPVAIPATVAGFITGKKVIIKITQAEFRPSKNKVSKVHYFLRKLRKKIVSKADKFIAISQQIKQELMENGIQEKKIIDIPNGVSKGKYHPVKDEEKKNIRKKLDIKSEALVVMYAGALNARKGTYDLLEAFRKLKNVCDHNLEVILCGPDHEGIYLNYIKDVQYPVSINYIGSVNNLNEYYQAADIFILPSYSEGLPNVLLEAAMSGLSIIASDIGGNRDIIRDGYSGLLYPKGNPEFLREKVIRLINDKELRFNLAKNAIINTRAQFSLSSVSQAYINLYNTYS